MPQLESLEARALLSATVIDTSINEVGDISLNSVDEATTGDDLTVNSAISVESTTGSVTLSAGDDLILQATSSITAATFITLNLDAADADVGVGSTATLSGQLTAGTAVGVVGGADADSIIVTPSAFISSNLNVDGGGGLDSFEVDLTGVTNPVLNATGAGSFTITSDDHATITLTSIESVSLTAGSPDFVARNIDLSGSANAVADVYSLASDGAGNVVFTLNGLSSVVGTQASTTAWTVTGSSDDDTLTVDHSNGIIAAAINFVGGAGSDKLAVIGNGTANGNYTPSATTTGNGTISVTGAGLLTFSQLEPVDISGMATATLTLPGANDIIAAQNGFDFSTGVVPALIVGGTSAGVTIETAAFFNNTNLVIDTSTTDGNDAININSASNAHGNTNITFTTGVGSDAIVLNGNVTTIGNQQYSDPVTLTTNVALTGAQVQMLDTVNVNVNTLTIDATSMDNQITGVVSGTGGITKRGTGILKLDGANDYTGVTTLTAGTIWVSNSSSLGATGAASNTTVAAGAEVFVTGNFTVDEDLDLMGSLVIGNANSAVWGGAIAIAGGAATVDASLLASAVDITGVVSGSGGLTKTGAGQVSLSAVNTFTGTTILEAGTTIVNGQLATGADVVVQNTAILMGAGTIAGSVSVESGAEFAPGTNTAIINTGNFDLRAGSTLTMEVDGKTTAGTNYDQVNVTGTVTLGGTLTIVDGSTDTGVAGDTITLINNDGVDAVTGTFNGLANGSMVTINSETWRLLYNGGDGNDVVLVWGTPKVSIADAAIAEGDSGQTTLNFTVTVDSPLGSAFRVTYATADNSADSSDYTSANATLNFTGLMAGETRAVSIALTGDEVVELNETFLVTLTNILDTGVVTFSDNSATGTITNDDTASISIGDVSITEGDTGTSLATFVVTLDTAVDTGVSLAFDTSDATATTADSDYVGITGGNLAFTGNAGETLAISVTINGDATEELDETFLVDLSALVASGRNVSIVDAQAVGTIIDDDRIAVEFSTSSNSGIEAGSTVVTLTATAATAVSGAQTFDVVVTGTGISAADYVLSSTTVTIADGATTGTVTFTIQDDAVVELAEVASVSLTNPSSGVRVGSVGSQDITITDNDAAQLSIADVSIAEGASGTSTLTFTVTLDNAVDASFTVDAATADSTATVADLDYVAASGPLTFAGTAGETQTMVVDINGDATVELNEAFFLNLSNIVAGGRDVTLANAQATGTITNDDSATLSIDDVTVTEGDSGSANFTFTVTLNAAVDSAVTVSYDTADDTATTADSDYVANTGNSLTFVGTAGETATFIVAANGDTKVEAAERFFVNLSNVLANGRAVTIADAQGEGTINNDDTGESVDLSVSLNTGTEAAGTVITLTATSLAPVSGDQTVDVQVTGITTDDYMLGSATITILDGQTTGTTTFTVVDDAVVELLETATVSLVNPSIGLTLGSSISQVISIVDNDSALLSIADVTLVEGHSGTTSFVFTVTLDTEVDSAVVIDYATTNGSAIAGSDFTAAANTLTFTGTAGETQTLEIMVTGDETVELNESFFVNLSSINASGRNVTFADNQARATITNDDIAFLSINDVTQVEGDSGLSSFVFTVTLDTAVDSGVTVAFSTADGTATLADSDYVAGSGGSLSFVGNAGEIRTVEVVVVGDTTIETDEAFSVNLSSIAAAGRQVAFANATGVGTIRDDDGIAVDLSVDATTGTEAGTTVITLTATAATAVTENETVDVMVSGVTSTDYNLSDMAITILAGQTTGTVTFTLVDDAVVELTEIANLTLVNPSLGLSLGTVTSQSITITDNDTATISIGDVTVTEGDSGIVTAEFVVTLNAAVDTGLSINYATADGTATVSDGDYAATSGTLNFTGTAGETMTISVDVTGDTTVELDQTFAVDLTGLNTSGRSVTVTDDQGLGTITNDDSATLSISDVSIAEGDSGLTTFTFVVTLDKAVDTSVVVSIDTADGTATVADNDYVASSAGSLTFTGTAGETRAFQVLVNGDTTNELDETFFVDLSNAVSGGRDVTIGDAQAIGTIADDDGTPVNLALSLAAGNEAGTTEITVIASTGSIVSVDETIDVVVTGTGITSGDYTLSATTITIPAGQQVGTVTFTVVDDAIVEAPETALISITNPSIGLSLGTTTSQTVTITSDDSATISIADVSVIEGDLGTTTATFVVTLDNAVEGGLTVDYATADNTAVSTIGESDYVPTNGTLTFVGTAGETQAISVTVNSDTTIEPNETFVVDLSNLIATAGSVTIADAQGEATITDDDTVISVELSADLSAGTEFAGTIITLTATANLPVVGDQTVDVQVGGTNITLADYLLSNATITILNGETTGTATFTVLSDGTLEGTETATISLANQSAGIILGAATSVDVTIADYTFVTLDPISNFPGNQPTVTWQPAAGAVRYEIWFARIFPQQVRIFSDTQITGTSWTPPDALASGFYRYWVRAFDINGNASGWSADRSFEVRPTLIGPVTPTFNQRPTFTWDAIPFAPGYEIFIRTTSGDIVVDDISGTSYTPLADLPNGPVRWWIRSSDAQANRGWSLVGLTNVDRRTTVTGPASPTTDTTPTITWQQVEGAGRYILFVQNADTTTLAFRDDNVTETSYTPAAALPAGNYRVWVKAIDAATNAFNSGLWSNAFNFQITASSQEDVEQDSPLQPELLPQLASLDVTQQNAVSAKTSQRAVNPEFDQAVPAQRFAEPYAVAAASEDDHGYLDALMAQPLQLIDLLQQTFEG